MGSPAVSAHSLLQVIGPSCFGLMRVGAADRSFPLLHPRIGAAAEMTFGLGAGSGSVRVGNGLVQERKQLIDPWRVDDQRRSDQDVVALDSFWPA